MKPLPISSSASVLARVVVSLGALCSLSATSAGSPQPDLSYGGATDGIARVDFDFIGRADNGRAGVALVGNRLLIAGMVGYDVHEREGDVGFARLDSGGRLDPDFGAANDGRARVGFSGAPVLSRIAHADDGGGTLFVGGMHDLSAMTIGRLDRTGAVDTGFNGVGFRSLGGGFFLNGGIAALATDVSRLPDGKVLVSGAAGSKAMTCFALARLNADGSTDTSFGNGGSACAAPHLPGGRPFAYSSAHAMTADGRILLAGWGMRPGGSGYDMVVARFTANGVLDTSFGPAHDGWTFATFEYGGIDDYARAITVDSVGRIVVAGDFPGRGSADLAVVRWLPDGHLDAEFGQGGKVWFNLDWKDGGAPSDDAAHSVFVLPDRRILIGGQSSGIGTAWMLKSNGDLDRAFADDGVLKQAYRNAPIDTLLAAEDAVLSGDYLYMVGTIRSSRPNGHDDEDFGAVRYLMPLFRDGFDSAD